MKLNLISLATVKAELGITDATHDSKITAMIPKVSSDVRRILNDKFDTYVPADINNGSNEIVISGDTYYYSYYDGKPLYSMGQVLYSPGIPDDTYITDYSPNNGKYTISNNATGDSDYMYPTLKIAQWAAVSKMIWYRIGQQNMTSVNKEKLASLRYGPVAKTYADSEINKQYNYPQILIDDLGVKNIYTG